MLIFSLCFNHTQGSMLPESNIIAFMEALHPMLVADSGYKVCTIVADLSGKSQSNSVHLISNVATSFSTSTLDRLRKFLRDELPLPNSASQKELYDECEANLDLDEEVEEEFAREIVVPSLEKEIDVTAEHDLDVQDLQQSSFFPLLSSARPHSTSISL